MIKKSQFALVCLTICAMLAVWFIKSPLETETSTNDILEEIKKPLRDIRDNYPTPVLKSDVLHIEESIFISSTTSFSMLLNSCSEIKSVL